MSAVDRNDVIAFVAGSLAGESPLSIEDAVAAALRLLDEFDDHGWTVHNDRPSIDDDEIKIEFDPAVIPRWLSVGGKRYDVVESPAEELARRFDEVETTAAVDVAGGVELLEVDEEIETINDTMVATTMSGDDPRISWLGAAPGVSREMALRHAAWIVALADPLQERFPKVLRAVMST